MERSRLIRLPDENRRRQISLISPGIHTAMDISRCQKPLELTIRDTHSCPCAKQRDPQQNPDQKDEYKYRIRKSIPGTFYKPKKSIMSRSCYFAFHGSQSNLINYMASFRHGSPLNFGLFIRFHGAIDNPWSHYFRAGCFPHRYRL